MKPKKTKSARKPKKTEAASADASVRQLEAEGTDVPAHKPTRRTSRKPAPTAAPAEARSGEAQAAVIGASPEPASPGEIVARIRELEARLGMGQAAVRTKAEDVDPFGYDPSYEHKVLPFFEFLYERYFRVEARGVSEHIPSEGRCLLVANHSGTLPFDGVMLRLAVRREHPRRRDVRWLAEDAIFTLPFLGTFTNRIGAVRACQENAERLLESDSLVAVFPEGMKGIGKLYRDRYRLQRFGRGGFVKLCLRTRTPVVPVAIVGGEETNPMIARVDRFMRAVGLPYLPVTPTFPLLGPAGLLPAPTKWKIVVGEPIDLESHGAEAADDEILVARLTERVRGAIQAMLDRTVGERKSVWFG